ncbi:MAG: hypothetical protein ABEI97_00755 [Candidatus Nanohaloarchaea archaeon]
MELDGNALQTSAFVAVLLAGFFVAGFLTSSVVAPSTPTGDAVADHPHEDEEQPAAISPEAAADKAMQKLASGPLSYPFTYNLTVESITNDTRIPGTTFYSTTFSYVVEPNPFQGQIYSVPANQTSTTKTLTVYVSQDGEFMFQNEPIPTKVQQRQAPSGVLPR